MGEKVPVKNLKKYIYVSYRRDGHVPTVIVSIFVFFNLQTGRLRKSTRINKSDLVLAYKLTLSRGYLSVLVGDDTDIMKVSKSVGSEF